MKISKKGLIIVITLALIMAAAVGAYFAFIHNPVINEFVFETVSGERKIIPLPERTRHDKDAYYITYFVSDLSADEILAFYDDYVKDFKKAVDYDHAPTQTYYYDEAQQIVFKYAIFPESSNRCVFSISYEEFSDYWRILKG